MTHASEIEDRVSLLQRLGFEPEPPPTRVRSAGHGRIRVDAERAAMGTRVALTAIGGSVDRLEESVGRAFEEMDRLIPVFSRHLSDSALSQLNDAGRLARPPRELDHVLRRAGRIHRVTRGAFDISVAPLVDLFRDRLSGPTPAPPSDAEIAETRALVGARHVASSRRQARLGREGMRLTLDGIAKGYIVDRMAEALESAGVRDYLVDGGGDIRTRGLNAEGRPWAVAVRDPRDPASFLDVVRPGAGAVATSGSYEHFYDSARRYHHLVDAGTGLPAGRLVSVTVLAPTAMAADALATAAFLMDPAEGLALVDSLDGCAAQVLDRAGRCFTTRGWPSAPSEPDT